MCDKEHDDGEGVDAALQYSDKTLGVSQFAIFTKRCYDNQIRHVDMQRTRSAHGNKRLIQNCGLEFCTQNTPWKT